jgi:hypothetical protein
MSGKVLYDKHCMALKQIERRRWNANLQRMEMVFPTEVPPVWQFLDDDRRRYYEALAKLLTPKPRKATT